jgi:c-di-GMP-binding flagellar brake protein YcgR
MGVAMRYARNMLMFVDSVKDPKAEHRTRGRFARPPFRCSFGAVEDVSATGMRVRMRGGPRLRKGQTICITLLNEPERGLAKVQVVWVKRVAFRTNLVGLLFVDLSDEAREVILRALSQAVSSIGKDTGRKPRVA